MDEKRKKKKIWISKKSGDVPMAMTMIWMVSAMILVSVVNITITAHLILFWVIFGIAMLYFVCYSILYNRLMKKHGLK